MFGRQGFFRYKSYQGSSRSTTRDPLRCFAKSHQRRHHISRASQEVHVWLCASMHDLLHPKTLTELFQEVIWLLLFDYQNQVIHVDRRCQSCNCQEWPGKHKLKTWRSISSIGVSESRTENENMKTQMLVELQKHSSNSKTNRQNHVNKKTPGLLTWLVQNLSPCRAAKSLF